MYQSTYYIDKSSGTFADNLAAFGLAFVISTLTEHRTNIQIDDIGPAFAVVCQPAVKLEWVQACRPFTGAPFLMTWDNKSGKKMIKGTALDLASLPEQGGQVVVDYQVEKQNRETYFTWYKNLPTQEARRQAMNREILPPVAPHANWEIFRAINPAALQGYNGLMEEWWRGQAFLPQLLEVLLRMTAQFPNDIDGAEIAWKKICQERGWKSRDMTASQFFNPSQGKGINSPQATFRAPGNIKSFWLLEWLKVVGLFYGGITRIVANPKDPRNAKDRKTYVLSPVHLDWQQHLAVMNTFHKAMLGSFAAIQLDVMAALRYTQAFLTHFEGAREPDAEEDWFGHGPGDLVSGMQMAFYKNLGNAVATMNIAAINLPRWVILKEPSDLARLRDSLQEHIQIVSRLDETRGDQYALLNRYRDFMSGNDLEPFFEFTNAYSGFLISQRERNKPVKQFTTTTLEVLFMNSDDASKTYTQIVQNPGFRNVAYAIRHSTVIPQRQKGMGKRLSVDIRYGLGQQLARKAAYPGDFLAELAEFAQLYNGENAQLSEKKRNPFRKDITTADLDCITELVDQFGSKVVCNMLVAYGYAREPKEAAADDVTIAPELEGLEPESGESIGVEED